ncbi:Voltage-gated potassium channel subunit beta-1 [Echinococcus granulosus]|uniref:Voltage gated potassium channel subunit n=1 Tax=Echinococcus granulosus TaxID=6210 RepID=A0A068WBQ0_ECHGR|nr:Voltage-gated potassium channel subunit beta-1 [Echinococcus granulosus]CDS15813.1 voltage gated potassium channel subunit [Echinococcus granulosus]
MQYRKLGGTGLRVSCLGLGTAVTFGGQISDEMAEKITTLAYNSGVNFFDTAEYYSDGRAERTLGKILKSKGWRRSSFIVCTKLLRHGSAPTEVTLSRKRIIEGLLGSLERLQLDYVDIVLISRDPERVCTIEEIVRACTFTVQQGWTFYWGTSNWPPGDIMEAHTVARLFHLVPPSMECMELNLLQRDFHEYGLPELCVKLGLGLVSGAPLAKGLLSGKYLESIPRYSRASLQGQKEFREQIHSKEGQDQLAQVSKLSKLAHRLGISLPQLSIAWCLKSDYVNSVILGAATVDQLQENLGAISAISTLTNPVLGEIENILISDHQSTEDFL